MKSDARFEMPSLDKSSSFRVNARLSRVHSAVRGLCRWRRRYFAVAQLASTHRTDRFRPVDLGVHLGGTQLAFLAIGEHSAYHAYANLLLVTMERGRT